MDGKQGKRARGKKQTNKRGARENERAAQNMRLKCNVLERERDGKTRACHAVRRNCTLAECGENKEEEKAPDTLYISPPF